MNKKIFILMFAMVFLIGIASASFIPIKQYDEETETVTIVNTFGLGKDLATATLTWGDTKVGVGIDVHVGTFNYTMLDEDGTLEDLDLINLKNDQVMTRGKQYKILTYKEEDNYANQCADVWSETNQTFQEECVLVEDGKRIVEEWIPLVNPNFNFTIGKEYTIGVFVDTEEGDNGDWIPTFVGKEVDEWATWTSSLSVGLVSYYKLDNNDFSDAYGSNDATNGGTTNASGKILSAREWDGSINKIVDLNSNFGLGGTSDMTFSGWINPDTLVTWRGIISKEVNSGGYVSFHITSGKLAVIFSGTSIVTPGVVTTQDVWQHVAFTYDGTTTKIYVDGVNYINSTAYSGTIMNENFALGTERGITTSGGRFFNGEIDEVAIFNVVKSQTEIELLAQAPPFDADQPPKVVLNSPANNSTFGYPAITFNATVSDAENLVNVSLLIDGVIDQTNTSGINGTYYIFSKSLTNGEHNWSILAHDNASHSNQSETRTLNITIISPTIELSIPIDNLVTTTALQTFYAYVYDNGNITNVSFYYDGSIDQTDTSGLNASNYTFNKTLTEGSHTWYIQAFDNDSFDSTSATRTITLDTISPKINIVSPIGVSNYSVGGDTLYLNFTVTDENLDTCISEYNGANTTRACSNSSQVNYTFSYVSGIETIKVYANDSSNNWNSTTKTWNVRVSEINRTSNTSSYETKDETFIINVNANTSLSSVVLDYNGTEYSTTKSGTEYSRTIDVPLGVDNNSVRWKFTYAGDSFYSTYSYQNISLVNFSLCDAGLTDDFLNISFKDEDDLSVLNASIPLGTFVYYIGSGTVNKTYTYQTAIDAFTYRFCAIPTTETINVKPYVQYKQDSDYPQRIWNAVVQSYTSTLTDQILYLLDVADGLYVTFQVINAADQTIDGVDIQVNRTISGSEVIIGSGTTDAAGSSTFWLNPDFIHDFLFVKTGYTTFLTSFAPTQSSYTITLGQGGTTSTSYLKGMNYFVNPTNQSLTNDTSYDFGFRLTSEYWDLDEYGFFVRLDNGTKFSGGTTTLSGTQLTLSYDTTNQSRIYLDYYWKVDGNYTNGTSSWRVYNTDNTQWSVNTFFTDLNLYLDSGFFGIDDFGRYILIFLTLFLTVGIVGYKFGVADPIFLSVLTFFVIFFMDVSIGIIPEITLLNGNTVPNLLTFISGLIALVVILMRFNR